MTAISDLNKASQSLEAARFFLPKITEKERKDIIITIACKLYEGSLSKDDDPSMYVMIAEEAFRVVAGLELGFIPIAQVRIEMEGIAKELGVII